MTRRPNQLDALRFVNADRLEAALAQRDALRDALTAALRRERTVGGYCSHEDQQARRDAEALLAEIG